MAKRFTDTDKWKDDWYISLGNDYRIIWQWLLDNCNHAGICKRSLALLNRDCNTRITEDDLLSVMEGRVIAKDTLWFIPKFLKFQYNGLNNSRPVTLSVIKELEKTGLAAMIPEGFGNDYLIIKDKDKDKVISSKKDKPTRTREEKKEITLPFDTPTFEAGWNLWKAFRKEQHKFTYKGVISEQAALKHLFEISGKNEKTAIAIINESIHNSWAGLFELKNNTATSAAMVEYQVKENGAIAKMTAEKWAIYEASGGNGLKKLSA